MNGRLQMHHDKYLEYLSHHNPNKGSYLLACFYDAIENFAILIASSKYSFFRVSRYIIVKPYKPHD